MNNLKYYSGEGQDQFVSKLIKNGIFFDIGCGSNLEKSNSKFLEDSGWTGYCFDIQNHHPERKCIFKQIDATSLDFENFLINHVSESVIDYISLDIDNYSLDALKIILKTKKFKIMTFEHDYYQNGDILKSSSRNLLINNGYELLFGDVCFDKNSLFSFEDWWINPNYIKIEKKPLYNKYYLDCINYL